MARFYKFFILFLFCSFLGFLGCDKEKPVTTGSISGTLNPKRAALSVKATSLTSSAKSYSATVDSTFGSFAINNVDAGDYLISFTNNANILDREGVKVTAIAGQDINIGTVYFEVASVVGVVSPVGSVDYIAVAPEGVHPSFPMPWDTATGVFKTTQLPTGSYYIRFGMKPGYKTPASVPTLLNVRQGRTINLDTIFMIHQ